MRARKTSSRSGVWTSRPVTASLSSRPTSCFSESRVPSCGTLRVSDCSSPVAPATKPTAVVRPVESASSHLDSSARNPTFELGRRALGDQFPPSSTPTLWASASASSRYWVVRKMVTPSSISSRMICHSSRGCAGRGRCSARRERSVAVSRPASSRGRGGASCRPSTLLEAGPQHRRGRTGPADPARVRGPAGAADG